jgi:hypothetical protein
MRNFFLIKHHPRGLTEAYQENSCRTPAPRHTLPAFAGCHDDENLISLTRPSVNNPNPIMQSERVVLGEQATVSFNGRILLVNPQMPKIVLRMCLR